MGITSDPGFLVLHGLRLKGVGAPAAIAAATGLDAVDVTGRLGPLAGRGLAVHHEGRLAGWALTPAGRAEQERLAAAELDDDPEARSLVVDAYQRFRALNRELLDVVTAWQIHADGTANDHTDAGHDAAVLERLRAIVGAVRTVVDDLAGVLERYRPFGVRFDRALTMVLAGDTAMIAKPGLDSVHTVWFELHEDLLSTLRRTRHDEATALEAIP